jgi:hypothetical protein
MHATTQAAVAAALSSVAGVLGLPAQATPPPAAPQTRKPPAYQALRQNEDWSVLADEARTGVDAIKYLPLRDDRAVWLSLGGEARLRGEAWDGFRFGNPPSAPASDVFVLSRLRLHADLHLGPHLRTFVEGITAWATDRAATA